MKAQNCLPGNYIHLESLDFSKTRIILGLNLLAIPLLFVSGWFFRKLLIFAHHLDLFRYGFLDYLTSFSGWEIIALLISIIIMLILHELIHGIFFWIATHERPRFALRSGYAFTAAPGWYLPRNHYIWVGLAPLLLISVVSVFFSWIGSSNIVPFLYIIAVFNAAGSLGDVIVAFWVLKLPPDSLVNDKGDIFDAYIPSGQ